MGEKTEKATPKKLRDARGKGQVAKSQDLPAAFTFIVSIWVVLSMTTYLNNYLSGFLIGVFKMVPNGHLDSVISGLFYQAAIIIFYASIPVLAAVCAVGVLVNFAAVGPVFTFEVFKFDIKKFDPVQNLKAKFKLKTLVELIKSIVKISIASYIIYTVMYKSLPVLVQAVSMPLGASLLIFNMFLVEVVVKVGLFFIVVAVIDFVYQKYSFSNEMKMEKFEVKQEYKNSEGDPHIKGKRKQIAQEIAYSDGPEAGARKAQAVVTNPVHLAIAIGYNRDRDPAPYILAMGDSEMATRIIKVAERSGVPIIRNISLAHKLWDRGELYDFVPEDTYEALAEILRWIAALQTESQYDYVEPE